MVAYDWLGFAYALAVAGGGLFGYVKKGSLMSAAAGLAFGGTAAYGAMQTSNNPQQYGVILGVSAILTGIMGMRYFNSGKIMPAGIVAAMSLAMAVRYGIRMTSSMRQN